MKTVASADATSIAYEQGGSGPNIVFVHGNVASRARWTSVRPMFEEHFTVVAIDRRGRGDSGDGPDYSIEREFEDIVAVVDALDPPVLLFGHSFGALCALGAAMRTEKLAGLILYEPAIYDEGEAGTPPKVLERMEALLAAGNREGVVEALMIDLLGLTPDQLGVMKASPAWPGRVAAAHTLPRELRAEDAYRLPIDRAGQLSTPVLLLLGGDSPSFFTRSMDRLASVLPNARKTAMPGQKHMAMDTAPDLLLGAVLSFWWEISLRGETGAP